MQTLRLSRVSKTYSNGVKALDDVSIEIEPGMFGLLGPNGAGKSTLMRTIATLQEPDQGELTLGDINIREDKMALRKVLGYLPQEFGVYPKLSAEKLLHYFAQLKGVESKKDRQKIVDFALEITNLSDVRKKSVAGYSGGMKQRFGIAQLLLNDPHLIIVDEPTAGLDPAERHRFLNVLRDIGTNHIVILSTHIVDDVKELCTDMAILNGGKLLNHHKPTDAIENLKGKIWNKVIDKDALEYHVNEFNVISRNYNQDHSLNIRVRSDMKPADGFNVIEPELSDVYFVSLKEDEVHNSNA
ncbi:ABC transporter ATP-binding protein [Mesohalobacter halotolerans]|jgi:ABC-type multidrug transport system ATPase subunit|uniref:ABC transporter ATP-binding protein n=1 Tax=Mesohalobacter halotolerans TaxID=1883405 RepID=A0A4V6ALF0_9FLAO|nr:ABC transporter ATP-binding protein [Mesohalobacter halotolerans]NBC57542.1 ATP-binding cassette domain-containing protein [Bacteroidota bacterium]TKS56475.1 ABC transporter ATP-binding protein [Mesohalobacter halotolerans]